MNIKPVAHPSEIKQTTGNNTEARAKAIAAFTQSASPQPQSQVVQNQNNITPEEMSAIVPRQEDTVEDTTLQATETTEETSVTPEAPKVETPEEMAMSRQFAQLARQEKALRAKAQQQEQAYKAREAALAAREAELNAKSQTSKVDMSNYISKDMLKQDVMSTLEDLGITYDDITQQAITRQPIDPTLKRTINQFRDEIQTLKAELAEAKTAQINSQTESYKAAVKQLEVEAKNLVTADPVTYEAIAKTGTVREVVKLIEDTYKKDGILMSVEDAAKEVEEYLVEENYAMATKIEKIKKRMQTASTTPATPKTEQTPVKTTQKQTQPMKTLTNATSSTRQMSAKERAILAFKGELKS